jgi:hypothetical protein
MILDRAAIASLTGILSREAASQHLTHEQAATLAVTHLQALGWMPGDARHHDGAGACQVKCDLCGMSWYSPRGR